ncbi:hypothetical protein [Leptolyngbya ohadii]|uniref:hypothetical protein n=1 Tax=Leptolyngbya ohadii TaxID=1962290 RepID=UPI000B59D050|nr:hypothetical protein [Leptolyngbya ohadii]
MSKPWSNSSNNIIQTGSPGTEGYGRSAFGPPVDSGSGGTGIENTETLNTGNADDTLIGQGGIGGYGHKGAFFSIGIPYGHLEGHYAGQGGAGGTGIDNRGGLYTGNGKDTITGIGGAGGFGESGWFYYRSNYQGGSSSYSPMPSMGSPGGTGLSNSGTIDTGNGDDIVTGTAGKAGPMESVDPSPDILNSGTISTGNGDDIVRAITDSGSIGKIAGGGSIILGNGNDRIEGFGSQSVDGGKGFDTAILGIGYDKNLLSLGSTPNSIKIGEMLFKEVEQFVFAGGTYSLSSLQSSI